MDQNAILNFGKHKGKRLSDIPDGWFIWMYDRKLLSADLKKYAEQRIRSLGAVANKKTPGSFFISIKEGWETLKLEVFKINETDRTEQFRVFGKYTDVVIESNRPLFRNKGLKRRRPDWKMISGSILSMERITEAIMNHLEPKTNPIN